MNVDVSYKPQVSARSLEAIADCDIHPVIPGIEALYPYLSQHWQHYLETYGVSQRQGHQNGVNPYPKAQPNAARRDAWPPNGGRAGQRPRLHAPSSIWTPTTSCWASCNPLTPSGQGLA